MDSEHAKWVPLVTNKKLDDDENKTKEKFVSDQEVQKNTGNIFIVVACMLLAIFIGILLYWAYTKDSDLFISIISGLFILYTITIIIVIVVIREKLNNDVFNILLGSSSFILLVTLIINGLSLYKYRVGLDDYSYSKRKIISSDTLHNN